MTRVHTHRLSPATSAAALEQQLGEIEATAVKWTAMHGTRAGMGHLLLDITRGDRDDDPPTPA